MIYRVTNFGDNVGLRRSRYKLIHFSVMEFSRASPGRQVRFYCALFTIVSPAVNASRRVVKPNYTFHLRDSLAFAYVKFGIYRAKLSIIDSRRCSTFGSDGEVHATHVLYRQSPCLLSGTESEICTVARPHLNPVDRCVRQMHLKSQKNLTSQR